MVVNQDKSILFTFCFVLVLVKYLFQKDFWNLSFDFFLYIKYQIRPPFLLCFCHVENGRGLQGVRLRYNPRYLRNLGNLISQLGWNRRLKTRLYEFRECFSTILFRTKLESYTFVVILHDLIILFDVMISSSSCLNLFVCFFFLLSFSLFLFLIQEITRLDLLSLMESTRSLSTIFEFKLWYHLIMIYVPPTFWHLCARWENILDGNIKFEVALDILWKKHNEFFS